MVTSSGGKKKASPNAGNRTGGQRTFAVALPRAPSFCAGAAERIKTPGSFALRFGGAANFRWEPPADAQGLASRIRMHNLHLHEPNPQFHCPNGTCVSSRDQTIPRRLRRGIGSADIQSERSSHRSKVPNLFHPPRQTRRAFDRARSRDNLDTRQRPHQVQRMWNVPRQYRWQQKVRRWVSPHNRDVRGRCLFCLNHATSLCHRTRPVLH